MKTLPVIALFLTVAASPALHAVTAAWRLPLDRGGFDIRKNESVHRLDHAPAESGFFHPGDELWDLRDSGFTTITTGEGRRDAKSEKWRGDWMVWNQTTGRVVASGAWMDLLSMEHTLCFDKAPRQIRSRFRLITAAGERRAEWVTTGPESRGSITVDDLEISYSRVADRSGIYLDLSAFWPSAQPDKGWSVSAGFVEGDGEEQEVAHKLQGPDAWRLYATTTKEMADGKPERDARLIEEAGKIAPWPDAHIFRELGPGRWMDIFCEDDGLLLKLSNPWNAPPVAMTDYLLTQPPETLQEVVRSPVTDLREIFIRLSPDLEKTDFFAGYDTATSRLILAGEGPIFDAAQEAIMVACIDPPGPAVWVETGEPSGGWGLSVMSGEEGFIELREREQEEPEDPAEAKEEGGEKEADAGPAPELQFALEPMVSQKMVDLRYGLNVLSAGENRGWLTGSIVLAPGHPLKISSFPASDPAAPEIPVEMSARTREVIYIPR